MHGCRETITRSMLSVGSTLKYPTPEDDKSGLLFNYHGCPFSHINVWVTRRGSHHADAPPILLFVECSNDSEDMKTAPFPCLVSESSADAGRCFNCEDGGTKIVHPSSGSYRGQSRDFQDMASGNHSLTNN